MMGVTRRFFIVSASAALAVPAFAGPGEEHVDVLLRPVGNTVVTGSYNDDTMSIVSMNERVFGAEFGENPAEPNFADEPGFQSFDPAFDGLEWTFAYVDAVRVWNGSNFDDVAPHTVTMRFGGLSTPATESPTTPGATVPGFSLPVPVGGFHDHLDITYNGPEDATSDGIYLIALTASVTGFDASDPFYFVMNRGLSEEDHEAAEEFVATVIVPAPGAAAPLLGLGLLAARRRR
jgi:hypothetical protein